MLINYQWIDADKNSQQVKRGVFAKKLAAAVKDVSGKAAFANRETGIIRCEWANVFKVEATSHDPSEAKFWVWHNNCRKLGIQPEAVKAAFAAATTTADEEEAEEF